jgi:hypothetical protein
MAEDGLTSGHHILFLVEMAAGVILGFVIWSYISPMVTAMVPATPTA